MPRSSTTSYYAKLITTRQMSTLPFSSTVGLFCHHCYDHPWLPHHCFQPQLEFLVSQHRPDGFLILTSLIDETSIDLVTSSLSIITILIIIISNITINLSISVIIPIQQRHYDIRVTLFVTRPTTIVIIITTLLIFCSSIPPLAIIGRKVAHPCLSHRSNPAHW